MNHLTKRRKSIRSEYITLAFKLVVLAGVCCLIFSLSGCQSLPVKPSKDVSLKISISGKRFSVAAFVFIKEDKVRVDILRPFSGPFSHLYLTGEKAVFLLPGVKTYYQGLFNSQIFFPKITSLSAKWLRLILKGELPSDKHCLSQKQNAYCKIGHLEIFFKKQSSNKSMVLLRHNNKREIKIKIRKLSRKVLKEELFIHDISGYQAVQKWQDLPL